MQENDIDFLKKSFLAYWYSAVEKMIVEVKQF